MDIMGIHIGEVGEKVGTALVTTGATEGVKAAFKSERIKNAIADFAAGGRRIYDRLTGKAHVYFLTGKVEPVEDENKFADAIEEVNALSDEERRMFDSSVQSLMEAIDESAWPYLRQLGRQYLDQKKKADRFFIDASDFLAKSTAEDIHALGLIADVIRHVTSEGNAIGIVSVISVDGPPAEQIIGIGAAPAENPLVTVRANIHFKFDVPSDANLTVLRRFEQCPLYVPDTSVVRMSVLDEAGGRIELDLSLRNRISRTNFLRLISLFFRDESKLCL